MEVLSEIVDASTPSGPMAVLHKRPRADGDWPRVVMFHDGPGVRNATHVFAAKLAGEGYAVAVPDLYHRHGRLIGYEPHEREADPTLVDRLWELLASLTDEGIQADLDATLATLEIAPSERLGVIGFCVGARAAFRTLMRLPETFVGGRDVASVVPGRRRAGLAASLGRRADATAVHRHRRCGHDAADRGAPALSRRGRAARARRGRGVSRCRSCLHLARLAELRRERRRGLLPEDDGPVPRPASGLDT